MKNVTFNNNYHGQSTLETSDFTVLSLDPQKDHAMTTLLLSLVNSSAPFFASLRESNDRYKGLSGNQFACVVKQLNGQSVDWSNVMDLYTDLLVAKLDTARVDVSTTKDKLNEVNAMLEAKEAVQQSVLNNDSDLVFVENRPDNHRVVKAFTFGNSEAVRSSYLQKGKEKYTWSVDGVACNVENKNRLEAMYLRLA